MSVGETVEARCPSAKRWRRDVRRRNGGAVAARMPGGESVGGETVAARRVGSRLLV